MLTLLFGGIYYIFGRPEVEKARFEKLDKEANEYIQSIAKKYPGEVRRQKTCEYGSAKFSKGSLGCSVDNKITISTTKPEDTQRIIAHASELTRDIPWAGRTFSRSYVGGEAPIIEGYLFRTQPSCSIGFYPSLTGVIISAHCSGPALREYYPLKANP